MQTSYFKVDAITPLAELQAGARIHVIGVCGVAMAQLARLLSDRGYIVSGSDKDFYEPMHSLLKNSRIKLYKGYSAEHISSEIDLVVIGNAVLASNEEVLAAQKLNIKYSIFPQLLYELIIAGRKSIVVSGTHGKTTTTAMLAYLLDKPDLQASYFIGGAARDLEASLKSAEGSVSIVEGDEYDSAFFAKLPKFFFYKPNVLIITSVEFDHADIYKDLESINREFSKLVKSLNPSDHVLACVDDENLALLVQQWRSESFWQREAPCNIVTYGACDEAEVRLLRLDQQSEYQVVAADLIGRRLEFRLKLCGEHNAKNALAAICAASLLGQDPLELAAKIANFQGVKRRQELRYSGSITLIEDFAHHPSAVRETISALKTRYPNRKLWAVFEPRSNTSRRAVFQNQYLKAFKSADMVLLADVQRRSIDPQDLLDVNALATAIQESGTACLCLPNPAEIRKYLLQELRSGDVVLLMSNGSFDGLPALLEEDLKARESEMS